MNGDTPNLWAELVGPEHSGQIAVALTLLQQVPDEALRQGIERLNRCESAMPMLDPSAWLDGKRFDNVAKVRCTLVQLRDLRATLPEPA